MMNENKSAFNLSDSFMTRTNVILTFFALVFVVVQGIVSWQVDSYKNTAEQNKEAIANLLKDKAVIEVKLATIIVATPDGKLNVPATLAGHEQKLSEHEQKLQAVLEALNKMHKR